MLNGIRIEICCGSVTDCITASSFEEVDRIELNSALELGGLTPSLESFLMAKERCPGKKILCMVRPRPAGFVYTDTERECMLRDALEFLNNDADGIVFGCLNADHTIDEKFTADLTRLIHTFGKEAVFHKAFDETPDPSEAAETLIRCGVDRILTSGQKPSSEDGIGLIRRLQERYSSDIEILPGGGVTESNAAKIIGETGCRQIHMTAKEPVEDCGSYYAVSASRIRKILRTIRGVVTGQRIFSREDTAMIRNDTYEDEMLRYEDEEDRRY